MKCNLGHARCGLVQDCAIISVELLNVLKLYFVSRLCIKSNLTDVIVVCMNINHILHSAMLKSKCMDFIRNDSLQEKIRRIVNIDPISS